jgi:hypothetical protein
VRCRVAALLAPYGLRRRGQISSRPRNVAAQELGQSSTASFLPAQGGVGRGQAVAWCYAARELLGAPRRSTPSARLHVFSVRRRSDSPPRKRSCASLTRPAGRRPWTTAQTGSEDRRPPVARGHPWRWSRLAGPVLVTTEHGPSSINGCVGPSRHADPTESCSALRLLPACAVTRSRETSISSATAKPRTEIALRSHNRAPAQSPEADLALTNSAPRSNDPSTIKRWHRGYQMAQASRLVAVPNGKVRRPSSRGGLPCVARHVAHAQLVPKGDLSTVHVPAQLG